MTSAELRWFWRGHCPQPVYDWFFESGLPPGGGQSKVDRYIPQRGEPEMSLKRRDDKPDFEVKGLVTTRRSPELEPLAPHIEIWCKWPYTIPGVKTDEVAVTKTRWLRKFPEPSMAVTWALRRSADKAAYTIETSFSLPADFPGGGIANVPGILMKQSEQARGTELAGIAGQGDEWRLRNTDLYMSMGNVSGFGSDA